MNLFPELPELLGDLEIAQDGSQRRIQREQERRNIERSKAQYERRSVLLEKIKGKRKPDPAAVAEIAILSEQIQEARQVRDPDLMKRGAEVQLVYYREVVKFLEGVVNG